MGDDIHVWPNADISRHRRADPVRPARDCGAAVNAVHLYDGRVGVIERSGRFDVVRVECTREPQTAQVR